MVCSGGGGQELYADSGSTGGLHSNQAISFCSTQALPLFVSHSCVIPPSFSREPTSKLRTYPSRDGNMPCHQHRSTRYDPPPSTSHVIRSYVGPHVFMTLCNSCTELRCIPSLLPGPWCLLLTCQSCPSSSTQSIIKPLSPSWPNCITRLPHSPHSPHPPSSHS
jgi:hypothetical protein